MADRKFEGESVPLSFSVVYQTYESLFIQQEIPQSSRHVKDHIRILCSSTIYWLAVQSYTTTVHLIEYGISPFTIEKVWKV